MNRSQPTRACTTHKERRMNRILPMFLAAASAMLASGTATAALDWQVGDFEAKLTNKLSMGAQFRTSARDPDLVGIANGGRAFSTNGDDGNLAFDQGDPVGGTVKLTTDLSMAYGEFGLFVRGSGLYNQVLQDATLFDPDDYQPNAQKEFDQAERQRKEDIVQEKVGADADLLDAYIYGSLGFLDRTLTARVGRQSLNWGESLLVTNGINSLQSFDVNQLRVPGFELEEVTVPVAMAWVSLDLVDNVSVEGFYQLDWEPTTIDAAGTFWSTNDFAGIGGTQANLGFGRAGENSDGTTFCEPPPAPGSFCVPLGSTVPRGANVEPSDSGQYGGALHFFIEPLNNLDLGLYGMNYHSRLPLISGISITSSATSSGRYFVEYPEDIQLYGLSFNTTAPWDLAVQGEYSYKIDQPLQVDDVEILFTGLGAPSQINPTPGATLGNQYLRGYRRHEVSQADFSLTRVFSPTVLFDQLSAFIEVAGVQVHGMPKASELAYDAPATYTPNAYTAALNPASAFGLPVTPYGKYATANSWGYKVATKFTYNNVFNVFTSDLTLLYQHDVNGVTPTPLANFVEDRHQFTFLLNLDYLSMWSVGLGINQYFGAGDQNLLGDRDFAELNLKFSF